MLFYRDGLGMIEAEKPVDSNPRAVPGSGPSTAAAR